MSESVAKKCHRLFVAYREAAKEEQAAEDQLATARTKRQTALDALREEEDRVLVEARNGRL